MTMKAAFVHVAKALGGEGYMVNPKCELFMSSR